jgi:hypothetical protein
LIFSVIAISQNVIPAQAGIHAEVEVPAQHGGERMQCMGGTHAVHAFPPARERRRQRLLAAALVLDHLGQP